MPWLIRHAAYIITQCRVRSHGKTALQLMKGQTSLTELLPFGEQILFKIPKTGDAVGSFEDRWESGVWLGCLTGMAVATCVTLIVIYLF